MAHLTEAHGVSQRRACAAMGFDRSSIRYRSVRPGDTGAREAMKAVAAERRRFGYRSGTKGLPSDAGVFTIVMRRLLAIKTSTMMVAM